GSLPLEKVGLLRGASYIGTITSRARFAWNSATPLVTLLSPEARTEKCMSMVTFAFRDWVLATRKSDWTTRLPILLLNKEETRSALEKNSPACAMFRSPTAFKFLTTQRSAQT